MNAAITPGARIAFRDYGVTRHAVVATWGDIVADGITQTIPGLPPLPADTLMAADADGRAWRVDRIAADIVDVQAAGGAL